MGTMNNAPNTPPDPVRLDEDHFERRQALAIHDMIARPRITDADRAEYARRVQAASMNRAFPGCGPIDGSDL